MTSRPIITKAQQIMHARAQIATFRANEGKPVPDYMTLEEKARKNAPYKFPPTLEELEAQAE